jgi:hypothetical protein
VPGKDAGSGVPDKYAGSGEPVYAGSAEGLDPAYSASVPESVHAMSVNLGAGHCRSMPIPGVKMPDPVNTGIGTCLVCAGIPGLLKAKR